jgi:hypothetical protein
MGIKGSATCVMNFEGAKGWLIGQENQGLKCMFTMMNAARIMVGIQGLGLAETGYQVSLAFAKERLQSRSISGTENPELKADPIIVHPDVRRMLLKQKVVIEGARAMAYWAGLNLDLSHAHPNSDKRELADDIAQIMTPIVKSFLTDEGYASCDQALQSMGGSGFTQDWPVEQLLRDGRITRIYEGTNGIQALDLVGRKLNMKAGQLLHTYLNTLNEMLDSVANNDFSTEARSFLSPLQQALQWLGGNALQDPQQAAAVASPLLRMFALSSLAVMWAKMADQADHADTKARYASEFLSGKKKAAVHYFRLFKPEMEALAKDISAGKESIMSLAISEF